MAHRAPSSGLNDKMRRFFKTLLLLLMIAALPVQGMAAVMQLSCGGVQHVLPESHAAAHEAVSADASGHMHEHPHAQAMQHHMHHDMADHEHAGQLADASPSHSHHAHGSCSACAACCIGAVAPPSTSLPPAERIGSQAVVVSLPALTVGGMPASLDRPPKQLPA